MISYPNAKINLGLKITSKRKDGFHNIDSFFLPIPLFDILEVKRNNLLSKKISITYSGFDFDDKENDLVLKAFHLLNRDFSLDSVKVHLHKNIPFKSGLGGGSSNAAFMLIMLNNLFSLGLNKKKLLKYAVKLGSDCSFFIINSFSHVSGIGDIVSPINFSFKGYYIVILKPNFNC